MPFQELFETYVLASAEHQEHAQEVLAGKPFDVDLGQGVAAVGDVLARAELIGTQSESLQTWMWSWANPGGFGEHVVRAARHARDVGEREGIRELTASELPAMQLPIGYRCSVITCGLAGGFAYYPVEAAPGTTAYLLLDAPALALPPVRLERVLTVLTRVAASGEVTDWRRALGAYASLRRLGIHGEGDETVLDGGEQGTIRVRLDELGRIGGIEGRLNARKPPP